MPGSVKVKLKVFADPNSPLSHIPSKLEVVWSAPSLLVQITVVPAFMSRSMWVKLAISASTTMFGVEVAVGGRADVGEGEVGEGEVVGVLVGSAPSPQPTTSSKLMTMMGYQTASFNMTYIIYVVCSSYYLARASMKMTLTKELGKWE